MNKKPILYIVDQSAVHKFNTGIQKVCRNLAKDLIEMGEFVIPVDYINDKLQVMSKEKIDVLSLFDGPSATSWGLGSSREEMEKLIYTSNSLIYPDLPDSIRQNYQLYELISHCRASGIKTNFIFYDAIPVILNYLYMGDPLWSPGTLHLGYMKNLNFADQIISISKQSEKDYIDIIHNYSEAEFYKRTKFMHNAKIKTVALPTDLRDFISIPPKIVNKNDINILYVSSFDTRKNHEFLYNAFSIVLDSIKDMGINVTLHIAGTAYLAWQRSPTEWWAERLPIKTYFNCDNQTILDLYELADFTVYPSLYEGFGLPVVESLAANTPVISSNGGSLREVAAGGGCIIFDLPEDTHDFSVLANPMLDLILNPDKIVKLQQEIPQRPVKTWKEYAKEILETLV